LYTWDSELRLAAVGGTADGEPPSDHSSAYDDGEVEWFEGSALGIDPGASVSSVQLVDDATVAYTTIDERSVVHQVERDGTPVRTLELTDTAGDVLISSGDGFVYWEDSDGPAAHTLRRRPLDGGPDETLVEIDDTHQFAGFDVSADGSVLAYSTRASNEPADLFVADSDGTGSTQVATGGSGPRIVGDEIIFVVDAGTASDGLPLEQLATVPVGGGDVVIRTDDRLSKGAARGRLADGRYVYGIRSYGFEAVLGVTDAAD
jgi:hypothetical protein